jgi:hypothetical protein
MVKNLTRKQFNELCKIHEPIYIADEYKGKKHWSVFGFEGIKGEYHQSDRDALSQFEKEQNPCQ